MWLPSYVFRLLSLRRFGACCCRYGLSNRNLFQNLFWVFFFFISLLFWLGLGLAPVWDRSFDQRHKQVSVGVCHVFRLCE